MKFIDKQLAIKLKEKGFDRPCFGFYNPIQDELQLYCANNKDVTYKNILTSVYKNKVLVDAPTIEQVLKWLREEKKIQLAIDIKRERKVGEYIWGYFVVLLNTSSLCCVQHYDFESDSYDAAAIAGIEYVINNLI